MTPLGLTLVLAAALCHATWNFFVKRINGGPELVWLFSALSTVLYLPLAIAIVVLQDVTFDLEQSLFIAGSVALHLAYVLLLQAGYRNGDLSLVYPMARATGPLLSTTFAVFFLGETVTAQMGLGAGVIICGVLFLTGGLRPRAANISVSLSFGLGVGLLIGGYTVWDAHAVATLLVPPLLLDYAAACGSRGAVGADRPAPAGGGHRSLARTSHRRAGHRRPKPLGLYPGAPRPDLHAGRLCGAAPRGQRVADGAGGQPVVGRGPAAATADLVGRDRRRGGSVGPGLESVTRSFRTATRPRRPP